MRQLDQQCRMNGLDYHLLNRNERVALFELDWGISGYEVAVIGHRGDEVIMGRSYEAREVLPSNDDFGKEGSRAFTSKERAEKYFTELSASFGCAMSEGGMAENGIKTSETA